MGMTDTQILTIALASVPTVLAVLMGILVNNSRLTDLRSHMDARFSDVDRRFSDVERRFNEVDRRFDSVDRRFDEMKEMWRTELHRVEGVLDAWLKHLETR
jgi:hypothetical protein